MSEPVDAVHGRTVRARYAFAGPVEELARTVPLLAGERVLVHGAVRLRGVGLLPRPSVLRLSEARLTVLAHYAFRPDRVWDLPTSSVTGLQQDGERVIVRWRGAAGETRRLTVTAWTGRPALDTPVTDLDALVHELRGWLPGPVPGSA